MDAVAVVTTYLGRFDTPVFHVPQSLLANYHDYEAPLRDRSMTPRLQSKIPKMFAWQIYPKYDVYLWLDGNIRLAHKDSLKYFLDALKGYDVVVLQHPDRNTIWWEYRYNWRALYNNKPSRYMQKRYLGEHLDEQMQVIKDDPDYVDDLLVNGGVFMYRNTPEVRKMLKEWWYYCSRYNISDQISWAYVLKKSGLKVNVLQDNLKDTKWLEKTRHAK